MTRTYCFGGSAAARTYRKELADAGTARVSAVTGWEIETKRGHGLLEAPDNLYARATCSHCP